MDIRLTPAIYQAVADCITCGQRLESDTVIAAVYDTTGTELGLICTPCRESEPVTLRQNILHQVSILQQQAYTLERLIG